MEPTSALSAALPPYAPPEGRAGMFCQVAAGGEHSPPEPCARVGILLGAPPEHLPKEDLTSGNATSQGGMGTGRVACGACS
jgi:hypothetical protein